MNFNNVHEQDIEVIKQFGLPLSEYESHLEVKYYDVQHAVITVVSNRITAIETRGHSMMIPKSVNQLEQLKHLVMKKTRLNQVPKTINELEELRVLDLRDNNINFFPYIKDNAQLSRILLGSNSINKIPRWVSQLERIEQLYLGHNKISEIPRFIGELPKLEVLYLCHNQISALPESLLETPSLKELCIRGTPVAHDYKTRITAGLEDGVIQALISKGVKVYLD